MPCQLNNLTKRTRHYPAGAIIGYGPYIGGRGEGGCVAAVYFGYRVLVRHPTNFFILTEVAAHWLFQFEKGRPWPFSNPLQARKARNRSAFLASLRAPAVREHAIHGVPSVSSTSSVYLKKLTGRDTIGGAGIKRRGLMGRNRRTLERPATADAAGGQRSFERADVIMSWGHGSAGSP